ncbi:MAG TPA: class I SAM-dependent methyltransferase [Ohtaekwangia sp.]
MIEIKTCFICSNTSFATYLSCKDYTVSHETFQLIKCTNCGLILTSPRPEIKNLGDYYISSDYISHTNKARSIIDSLYLLARSYTLKWKLNIIKENSESKEQLSVLDYGCGTGHFLKACYEESWKVAGIEPSDQARENSDPKIRSLIYSSMELLQQSSFDAITLWHVLEHVPEPIEVLQTLATKLKINGTLFIAIPNPNSWDASFYKEYWAGYDVPRHLWHFSQSNIAMIAKLISLQIVETIPMKLDAYYVSLLSEKYKHPTKKINNLVSGFIKGLTSNQKASKTHESSSLIYILKKT